MVVSVVHETNRLQAQIAALERENEHLKEIVRVQADRLAENLGDGHRRLSDGPIGW